MSCFSLHLLTPLTHQQVSEATPGLAHAGWIFHTPWGSEDLLSQKQAGQLDTGLSLRVARRGDTGEEAGPWEEG